MDTFGPAVNSFGAIELGGENMDGMNNDAVLILKYSQIFV